MNTLVKKYLQVKDLLGVMLPIEVVGFIAFNKVLNEEDKNQLTTKGYSILPIFESSEINFIGILRTKNLLGKYFTRNKSIEDLKIKLSFPLWIREDMNLLDLFAQFSEEKVHTVFICEKIPQNSENIQKEIEYKGSIA